MGALERFMLMAPESATSRLMLALTERDVMAFAQLNTRMRYWTYGYIQRTWGFERFLSMYTGRPAYWLALLDGKAAMAYGESVFRFFLRSATPTSPLDIVTTLGRFYALNRALMDDGYKLYHPCQLRSSTHETIGNLIVNAGATFNDWSLDADKSWSSEDHIGHNFKFSRRCGRRTVRVNLHLVRCEPYRHVLGTAITPLTCYMTGYEAVAPFARSTFIDNIGFALRNMRLLGYNFGSRISIRGDFRTRIFKIAKGPPDAYKSYHNVELGARYLGDDKCWTIPRIIDDPMHRIVKRRGASFEVLDWVTMHDEVGTYLHIGSKQKTKPDARDIEETKSV
ncbi:hypothetical protein DFP72DRAFT_855542 [Ephemerocybe angulata]|uniref:Uncharacterized protein n=1 Tax=Ephemerocybe angulata TaxID=980116 RepID=A0A8H6LZJ1_9AGAR|nr:hypothetical protein DFP72DRAFT_855542 [Tulosesus angulatus]